VLSEPRQGVYSLAIAWRDGAVHPILAINSSPRSRPRRCWSGTASRTSAGRAAWSDRDRLFAAACAVMIANAALTAAISRRNHQPAGLCYALAAFIACAALLDTLRNAPWSPRWRSWRC
jgi:hypothetical protein